MAWNPTCITQFVEARKSSTMVVIVKTDAGRGFLKAMGNPEGEHAMACDWVGTQLAKWFGLATLDQAIVEVDDVVEIRLLNGQPAQLGPALVTRAIKGESWSGDERQLKQLQNVKDISKLVVFDTWIRNRDRHSAKRQNYDNVFLAEKKSGPKLLAIDHTHCFGTTGGEITSRIAEIGNCRDRAVYGLFSEFRPFLDQNAVSHAARRLAKIEAATVRQIMAEIPAQWQVDNKARNALVDLIMQRAAYVSETLYQKIFPDKPIDFKDEAED